MRHMRSVLAFVAKWDAYYPPMLTDVQSWTRVTGSAVPAPISIAAVDVSSCSSDVDAVVCAHVCAVVGTSILLHLFAAAVAGQVAPSKHAIVQLQSKLRLSPSQQLSHVPGDVEL